MANPTIGIDVTARLDRFQAELAKLPNMGAKEAKALAGAMAKEIREATKATQALAKATSDGKKGVDGFGDAAGKAGQNSAKLAGALGLVSPSAAEAARTVADLADVGEVGAEVMGLLGVSSSALAVALPIAATAALALAGAVGTYVEDQERAARIAAEVADAHERLGGIYRSTRDATIDLQEATGALSEEEAALARNATAAYDALNEATAVQRERISALRAEQSSFKGVLVDTGKALLDQYDWLGLSSRAYDALTTDSGELQTEIDALNGTISTAIAATKENVEITNASTVAKVRNAAATREQRAAESEADQVLALRSKMADERANKERALRDEHNANLLEQEAINARTEEEITRNHAAEVAKRLADSRAAAEEEKRIEELKLNASASLFGSLSDIARTAREGMTEESKEAAFALFYVEQGAALATAAINAAVGVSQAAASAAPPINALPIAAAIGIGAANVAAVLAVPPPSFNDTPGAISLAQRQTMSFGSGDHVVAARDPKEVKRQADALNGLDPHADYRNGGPTVAVVGARAFGRRVADDVRLRTPLQRAIFGANGGPTGQRGRG